MNSDPNTEPWIAECFAQQEADKKHFAVYSEILKKLTIDLAEEHPDFTLENRNHPMDATCPNEGSYATFLEWRTNEIFSHYLKTVEEGFSSEFSLAYAIELDSDGYDQRAFGTTFKNIGGGVTPLEKNIAFQEVISACLALGKPPEFCQWCAEFIAEGESTFVRGLKKTEEHFSQVAKLRDKGFSERKIEAYFDAIWKMEPPYAELYAECVEQQISFGRPEREAEAFAEIYTDLFDRHGMFVDDQEEFEMENYAVEFKAEAKLRTSQTGQDEPRFSVAFERIAEETYPDRERYLKDYARIEQLALEALRSDPAAEQ